MIKTIAITVRDNDFYNTFMPMLGTLKTLLDYNENVSKEAVIFFVRESLAAFCSAFQDEGDIPSPDTINYLLKNLQIFFNEEARAEIDKCDSNLELFFLRGGIVGVV